MLTESPPESGRHGFPDDPDTVIHVLLADHREFVRAGLRAVLADFAGIRVVGEVSDHEVLIGLWHDLSPDVVIADARIACKVPGSMPDGSPATCAARPLRLVALVEEAGQSSSMPSIAASFILQSASREELVSGIRMVAAGYRLIAPGQEYKKMANQAHGQLRGRMQRSLDKLDSLTARERDVLDLLGQGLTNADISARLVIGMSTVKSHVCSVLRKLELQSRTEAVILAYEQEDGNQRVRS